jgi:hypothetical protein
VLERDHWTARFGGRTSRSRQAIVPEAAVRQLSAGEKVRMAGLIVTCETHALLAEPEMAASAESLELVSRTETGRLAPKRQ